MSDYEKPCPFCGSTNLKSGGDDKIVGTWCLDCEATGPNHYGRYEWNDRADRIEQLAATNEELEAVLKKLEYWFDIEADLLEAMTGDARADHMRKLKMIRDVLKGGNDG